jgi:hypothetical protein
LNAKAQPGSARTLWRSVYLMKLTRLEKKIRVGLRRVLDVFFEHDIAQYVTPRDIESINRLLETAQQSHGGPTQEQVTAERRSETPTDEDRP